MIRLLVISNPQLFLLTFQKGLYPDLSSEQSGVTYCFDVVYADTILNRINVYIGHNILMRKSRL